LFPLAFCLQLASITKHMLPSHEAITAFENELEGLAGGFGGRNDGWGCFAQKE